MDKRTVAVVFAALFLLLLLPGCAGRVESVEQARKGIAGDDDRLRMASLSYLMSLPEDQRFPIATELFLSQDPQLAWAGTRMFVEHEPNGEVWANIEARLDDYSRVRRYAGIAVKHGRRAALSRIVDAIPQAPDHDLAYILECIGLLCGQPALPAGFYDRVVLLQRWQRFLARGGAEPEAENALTRIYAAVNPSEFPGAIRAFPIASVVTFSDDLSTIVHYAPVAFGRELAIYLSEYDSNATRMLLLGLLASSDYITRFSAINSLEKLCGRELDFDPDEAAEARRLRLQLLRKELGFPEPVS
jgi:hypothetical protein